MSASKQCRIPRLLCITLVILLSLPCLISSADAFSIPQPTHEFYVNDFAELLEDDTERYIVGVNEALYRAAGAQVVVVTVDSLNGAGIEEYATELFREYGIGSREKNNGVLLLLAKNERSFRIEVGYGLEGILNDAKTGRIQDRYIIPYLKNDNWNDGILNGFNAIMDELNQYYQTDTRSEAPIEQTGPQWYENQDTIGCIIIGIALIGAIIIGKVFKKNCLIPNLVWIALLYAGAGYFMTPGYAIFTTFGSALFTLIGWAIGSPGGGSSSGSSGYSSYSSRTSDRSHSSHRSGSSRSHNHGGGGSSGGGGSTRKF